MHFGQVPEATTGGGEEKEPQYTPVGSFTTIISGPDIDYSKSRICFLKPEMRQSPAMECNLTSALYIGIFFQIPEKNVILKCASAIAEPDTDCSELVQCVLQIMSSCFIWYE